jgi:Methyltransferase domain
MATSTRSAYVAAARGIRSVADRLHITDRLAKSDRRWALHVRTLFAIHDVDALAALDLPWWVYSAIDRVDAYLGDRDGKARVFEYGSGASTIWLARRAGEVHSVEHHAGFASLMAGKVVEFPHVSLLHVPPVTVTSGAPRTPSRRHGHKNLDFTDYVNAIDGIDGEFDLIVIDGRAREACLRHAADRLAQDGVIVFDNTNRRRYQGSLRECGLRVETLRGAAPCLPYRSATSLLTRS